MELEIQDIWNEHVRGDSSFANEILFNKYLGKQPQGRAGSGWEANTQIDLRKIVLKHILSIRLEQHVYILKQNYLILIFSFCSGD
jgi:hypothetical protein